MFLFCFAFLGGREWEWKGGGFFDDVVPDRLHFWFVSGRVRVRVCMAVNGYFGCTRPCAVTSVRQAFAFRDFELHRMGRGSPMTLILWYWLCSVECF